MLMRNDYINIKPTKDMGLGVFSSAFIPAGKVISKEPSIFLSIEDVSHLKKTAVGVYYFEWDDGTARLALGAASIYNHSLMPNVDKKWEKIRSVDWVSFFALEDIPPRVQLFHNYHYDEEDTSEWKHYSGRG